MVPGANHVVLTGSYGSGVTLAVGACTSDRETCIVYTILWAIGKTRRSPCCIFPGKCGAGGSIHQRQRRQILVHFGIQGRGRSRRPIAMIGCWF
jgi:hypothetical protein